MSKIVATVDLGSNSFHLLISEIKSDGQVTTILKQKQKIELRAGLNSDLTIDEKTQDRAIKCLEEFAKEIGKHSVDSIRAVGTYTLRKARSKIRSFKKSMDKALGAKIKIISGAEEARLVYTGARYKSNNDDKVLVIDIGGGSTEFVIGKANKIYVSKSLNIGCLGIQKDFFIDDELSFTNFYHAVNHVKKIINPIVSKYKKVGWNRVLGSSGTIISLMNIANEMPQESSITKEFLNKLIEKMISQSKVENIDFKGLRQDRINVLAGGVVILFVIFDCLEVSQIELSSGAVREGLLYELARTKYKMIIK